MHINKNICTFIYIYINYIHKYARIRHSQLLTFRKGNLCSKRLLLPLKSVEIPTNQECII